MVRRRVQNPGPSVLALVNPRRRKKMAATKRRRKSTRGRRRTASVTARKNLSLFKPKRRRSRRRANPVARGRRRYSAGRRRRNPVFGGGVFGEAVNFAIAGFAIGAAQPIIQPVLSRFLPLGTLSVPVGSAVTGFALGWLSGMTRFTAGFKRPLQVMGIAVGVTALAGPLVRQFLGSGSAGMNGRRGMNGIAAVHGIPPQIVPPPLPPAQAQNGVNGLAMRPGQYAY
jgi:hypothetical protein